MSISGKILIDRAQQLLNDSPGRRSDDVPFYTPETLLTLATGSREAVFGHLLARAKLGNRSRIPARQRAGRITISRMIKSVTGKTDGDALPADFWEVICARTTTGIYVPPAINIAQGESLAAANRDTVWAYAGVWRISAHTGNLTGHTIYYYARPSLAIAYNDTVLTDFPDVFYHAVVTHIAIEAILQESLDVKGRYAQLEALFIRQIGGLK